MDSRSSLRSSRLCECRTWVSGQIPGSDHMFVWSANNEGVWVFSRYYLFIYIFTKKYMFPTSQSSFYNTSSGKFETR